MFSRIDKSVWCTGRYLCNVGCDSTEFIITDYIVHLSREKNVGLLNCVGMQWWATVRMSFSNNDRELEKVKTPKLHERAMTYDVCLGC